MRQFYETLRKGDVFWESCQLGNVKGVVTTEPKLENDVFTFTADITRDGVNITHDVSYRITKGMEHYGPKLYQEPAYVNIRGDEFWYFKEMKDTNLFDGSNHENN